MEATPLQGGICFAARVADRVRLVEGFTDWGGSDLRTLFLTTSTTVHTMPTLCTSAPLPHYQIGAGS